MLSQISYLKSLITKNGKLEYKEVKLPLAPYFGLLKQGEPQAEVKEKYIEQVLYASLVRNFMYGMTL